MHIVCIGPVPLNTGEWFLLHFLRCCAEGEEPSEGQQEEDIKQWVDDGSLPLEDDKLPFFLLDAHEEQAQPGTLYLFGKVCTQLNRCTARH